MVSSTSELLPEPDTPVKNRDLMLGNLERDLLEVVFPRSLDDYLVAIHACKGTAFFLDFLE